MLFTESLHGTTLYIGIISTPNNPETQTQQLINLREINWFAQDHIHLVVWMGTRNQIKSVHYQVHALPFNVHPPKSL